MNVLFAPDYRAGVPYQSLLADALKEEGVSVDFLSDYKRGLPLSRGARLRSFDVLHLHWPEAYFGSRGGWADPIRLRRFPLDLGRAIRGNRFVYTAHNLIPHRWANHPVVARHMAYTLGRAERIIVHSRQAGEVLAERWPHEAPTGKQVVLPLGDLAADFPGPVSAPKARNRLGANAADPFALVFGRIDAYKGVEDLLDSWAYETHGQRLVIVGSCTDGGLAQRLRTHPVVLAGRAVIQVGERISDEDLRDWLCACTCVLFNYTENFHLGGGLLGSKFWGAPFVAGTPSDG